MAVNEYDFTYTVDEINESVVRTNALLRAANALRLTTRDIRSLLDKPTIPRFFWTLIQITRSYNAIRRLQKLFVDEVNKASSTLGRIRRITPPSIPQQPPTTIPQMDLNSLNVRVDAFRENLPIGLQGIDLTDLPEDSRIMLQALIEDDSQITVDTAKSLLHGRILRPEESTGFLESSIHWQRQVDGVRILADAPYAWWVERGHRTPGGYFSGHWYLTDAVETARVRLPARIRNELNGLIFQGT